MQVASVPGLPHSVRVFIMRMRKTFEASSGKWVDRAGNETRQRRLGKAWDDSSRESRIVVQVESGQYLARAPSI